MVREAWIEKGIATPCAVMSHTRSTTRENPLSRLAAPANRMCRNRSPERSLSGPDGVIGYGTTRASRNPHSRNGPITASVGPSTVTPGWETAKRRKQASFRGEGRSQWK